jgi:hypothetical protein
MHDVLEERASSFFIEVNILYQPRRRHITDKSNYQMPRELFSLGINGVKMQWTSMVSYDCLCYEDLTIKLR